MGHYLGNILLWFFNRLSRIPDRDRSYVVYLMSAFLMATMVASALHALGNPTGSTLLIQVTDIGKALAVNCFWFVVWTTGISALLSLIYIPVPRLFLASFGYCIYASVKILLDDSSGTLFSYVMGAIYSIAALCVGLFLIGLFHKGMNQRVRVLITMLSAAYMFSFMYVFFDYTENKSDQLAVAADDTAPITEENPAQKGSYAYDFMSYGSGTDLQREEFGEDVDLITHPVDASSFITKWSEKREKFWGFDASKLPVNGRAWVPDGEGPFPVILMVHGNHTMEYFSTSGYDYLGELLASRGFIAISVDEDFINYSNVSGSPNDNYRLRAWMMLQHVVQLQSMNQTPGNTFYQKIDFDQVAFLGHSRGGQAAAMAADYETFFDDAKLLESLDSIEVKAVAALAPTDIKVDKKRANLRNISYLLLHGARDGDLNDFRGERQFYRTTFDEDDKGFKASLYIADANHSQFNTEWGRTDASVPKGLFLNRRQLMNPEDQRQIAKVYISAFFEKVFHENASYQKLFRDYRYGQNWLPDTTLVSKYENASYMPIVEFEQGDDNGEFSGGVTSNADGFTTWEVITPKDRHDHNRLKDAVLLEWEEPAVYTINIPNDYLRTRSSEKPQSLVVTMANNKEESIPEIQIELKTTAGVSVQLPLDEFMPVPPVITTDYTPFGLFDDLFRDGKYEKAWEPVFQTFEIPLESFEKVDREFDVEELNKITLHFEAGPRKVMVEGVGGSSY
ncbi:alpha/beta hydrolase family protein [Radiobacillus sp. PE A8.2]|uniref:alpha/beta hydrolase family protein n=1 Tax=Radiobacillus sp. PE A8.2 TaxID=3380349 RepID=UPI00388E3602